MSVNASNEQEMGFVAESILRKIPIWERMGRVRGRDLHYQAKNTGRTGVNPTDGQESGIINCSIPGLGRFRCDNGWLAPVYLHYLIKNKGASGINSQETTKKAIR